MAGDRLMPLGACVAGVMTLHLLMGPVLAAHPERVRADVDGYVATVECREVGKVKVLLLGGRRYRVAVADCATAAPVGAWPQKRDPAGVLQPWLGDAELGAIWPEGLAWRPQPAILCEVM